MSDGLLEQLEAYGRSQIYPFHMPGHKRRLAPQALSDIYRMDITEIDGFDDLHQAEGILKEAQERAAVEFGSEETHFLVGGSTAGILSAIAAVCRPGDEILIARNCHKSVYHAIEIGRLRPIYIYPQIDTKYGICGLICPQNVDEMWITHPNIRALVMTSPTYEGILSDIKALAEAAHRHHIPLIVDEAHGAHLHCSDYFPESAVRCGADLVIQSTHKTLPAMTQTALLHVRGELVDRQRLRRMLAIYQTSSPSYILMGSIDSCVHMLHKDGKVIFERYTGLLEDFRESWRSRSRGIIRLAEPEDFDEGCCYAYDRSKLMLSVRGQAISGAALGDLLLSDYGIQVEMRGPDYVLAMTGPGDDSEGFKRLLAALADLEERISGMRLASDGKYDKIKQNTCSKIDNDILQVRPSQTLSIAEAVWQEKEKVSYTDAAGRISGDYIYIYPPGIPLVTPGELIEEAAIRQIDAWLRSGLHVTGLTDGKLSVIL